MKITHLRLITFSNSFSAILEYDINKATVEQIAANAIYGQFYSKKT